MKVIQVLPALQGGGVERGTLEIASALVSAGHESWVLSAGGQMVAELEDEGSIHVSWDISKKTPLTFFQVRKLRAWLQAGDFDILHVRSRMPAWIVWLAWRGMDPLTRPRLVSTVHGMHSVNRYSEIMTCGEQVVAVSESIQAYILENYPRADRAKVRLIYRGVDPAEFSRGYQADMDWKNSWYKQYPQLENQIVVTLPGRLTRLKGHLAFLEALATLRKNGLPIFAVIVGGEDPKRLAYAREVYEKASELDLKEQVVFAGHRRDMKEIYSVSNLVVSLSSKPESFGRTVLEALSLGVPVLGYAHGGVKEVLSYLFPDGLVEPNDECALVDKMTDLLTKNENIIKINDRYLLSEMKSRTLVLYEEMLRQ